MALEHAPQISKGVLEEARVIADVLRRGVDLMRDPGGQLADGFHFLGVTQLDFHTTPFLLGTFALGDVGHSAYMADVSFVSEDGGPLRVDPADFPARIEASEFQVVLATIAGCVVPLAEHGQSVLGMNRPLPAVAEAFLEIQACDLFPTWINEEPLPLGIGLEDADGRTHAQGAKALFVIAQLLCSQL